MTELPEGFSESLPDGLGFLPEVLAGTEPTVSVRVNSRKGVTADAGADSVPWLSDRAFYLDSRPAFTFDPALHQGLYYPQDASSMIIYTVVRQLAEGRDVKYLDACAAPGGKTTAAIDALSEGSLVVANEYVRDRANVLAENIAKWGAPNVVVCNGDTLKFRKLTEYFDIVSADVPCSGEGMMRKDPQAVAQWSPALVAECAERQKEIIDNLWPSLKADGYFIYSTCTFNRKENEEMVRLLVEEYGAEPVDLGMAGDNGIYPSMDSPYPAMRFLPGKVRGEGLFMAVMRKPGEPSAGKKSSSVRIPQLSPAIRPFVKDAAAMLSGGCRFEPVMLKSPDTLYFFPKDHVKDFHHLNSVLNVIYAGVEAGTAKGKSFIPSQSLAMSVALAPDAFEKADTDYATAIAYLRREAVTLPDGVAKGLVLLTYKGHPLGFVKNLGNRANNLYPQTWRILSQKLPDSPPEVIKQ